MRRLLQEAAALLLRALQPLEQSVELTGQPVQLVRCPGHGQPAVERIGRDARDGGLQLANRPQRTAGEDVAAREAEREHDRDADR